MATVRAWSCLVGRRDRVAAQRFRSEAAAMRVLKLSGVF